MQDILIIGGGFAGVWSALGASAARRELRRAGADVRITLVTPEPYLTIRPRLYEPDPVALRVPLPDLLDAIGVELVLGQSTRIDTSTRTVVVNSAAGHTTHSYDRLILAAGSHLRVPAIPGAAEHAFNVDTHGAAMALDRHLNTLGSHPADEGRFTAVIVGAGLAGLEVATTMMNRLRSHSAHVQGDRPRVVLVERAEAVGPDLGSNVQPLVERALRELGVMVRVGTTVSQVDKDHVTLLSGEQIAAATTVWTAGLSASGVTQQIPGQHDTLGRLAVDAYLRVIGASGVFAAGDVAHAMADSEHVAPMSCQYAIPMGERAGRNAVAELAGWELDRFAPAPYVTCVDLGDWGALFTQGWDRRVYLTGFWGKTMKETINQRLIYPPALGSRQALAAARSRVTRSAA